MFTSWPKLFLLLYYYSYLSWELLAIYLLAFNFSLAPSSSLEYRNFFDVRNSVLRDIMPSLYWARIVCWLCLGWILVFPVGCPNFSFGLAIGFDMTAWGGRCHDPYLNCHFLEILWTLSTSLASMSDTLKVSWVVSMYRWVVHPQQVYSGACCRWLPF